MTPEQRLERIPVSHRGTYQRAMTGKSRGAAVKAFCCECLGYQEVRFSVPGCTDTGCPLFPYRPYQKRAMASAKAPKDGTLTESGARVETL